MTTIYACLHSLCMIADEKLNLQFKTSMKLIIG